MQERALDSQMQGTSKAQIFLERRAKNVVRQVFFFGVEFTLSCCESAVLAETVQLRNSLRYSYIKQYFNWSRPTFKALKTQTLCSFSTHCVVKSLSDFSLALKQGTFHLCELGPASTLVCNIRVVLTYSKNDILFHIFSLQPYIFHYVTGCKVMLRYPCSSQFPQKLEGSPLFSSFFVIQVQSFRLTLMPYSTVYGT